MGVINGSFQKHLSCSYGGRGFEGVTTPALPENFNHTLELYSSKAIAGKELSLSSWCIASLYIYHFSTVIAFSSKKYSGSTGHRNSGYQ